MTKLKIAERFYSIQGEGRYAGTPAYFIRLSGCNFLCNWLKRDGTREFCDTVAVWKQTKEEIEPFDLAQDIIKQLREFAKTSSGIHIVITGGEPALQKDAVMQLCRYLNISGFFIELETNGSIPALDFYLSFDLINWSPKNKSAGYGIDYYRKTKALGFWQAQFSMLEFDLKMVIANDEDIAELEQWVNELEIVPQRVYLMPVSNTRQEHQDNSIKLVEVCKRLGYKYSPRLHLMLWDKVVGV